ncbi:MAG: glucose-6-phosphate isomerase [Oligoflexales bacterium]
MINVDDRFFPPALKDKVSAYGDLALESLKHLQRSAGVHSSFSGWFNYPQNSGFTLEADVKGFVDNIDQFYDCVVVIGIGGSSLGAKAVFEALAHKYVLSVKTAHKPLLFLGDNISERTFIETLDLLAHKNPFVVAISKSGTTTEPAVALRVMREWLKQKYPGSSVRERLAVVTDKSSGALRKYAEAKQIPSFVIPNNIGGRFSVLTAVGLLPLALCGIDIHNLMKGANEFFTDLANHANVKNPVVKYACLRHAAYEAGYPLEILAFNEPQLKSLSDWFKQLFAESQGKNGKGIFPVELMLTTDLHSLGQFVQEGKRLFFETFLNFKDPFPRRSGVERNLRIPKSTGDSDDLDYVETRLIREVNNTALDGTLVAHADGGVPCLKVTMDELNEKNIGYLIAFFEVACALGADLLNVNPYDQPGVESYKQNLYGLLGKPGFESYGEQIKKRLHE